MNKEIQKIKKRPRDPIQLAKLIGDIATGQVKDVAETSNVEIIILISIGTEEFKQIFYSYNDAIKYLSFCEQCANQKNTGASILGHIGGKKGGINRAKALSPERRSEIAQKAALTRWGKK